MPERPAVPRDAAGRCGAAERIQIFEYPADPNAPASPVWHGWTDAGGDSSGLDAAGHPAGKTRVAASAEFEQRLAEEARRSFDAGREQGRQEERKALAGEQAQSLERQKRQMAALAESFAQARDRYLHAVEQEVVKLALAVAARILRREAQMDPLLLTGAVRVALGQLSASTEVRLRVPAGELDLWTEAIALLPNLPTKPAVVAGEGLRLGDCTDRDRGWGQWIWASARSWARSSVASSIAPARAGRSPRWKRAPSRSASGAGAGAPLVSELLDGYFARLERRQPWRWRGRVLESVGQTIESAGPLASVGECCEIADHIRPRAPGRGDRLSRLECAVHAGRDHRGHPLRRSGRGAGHAARRSKWGRR